MSCCKSVRAYDMAALSAVDAQRVLTLHGRLVPYIGRTIRLLPGAPIGADDLLSVGRVALLQAWVSFDPEHGVPFASYACRMIRQRMIDLIRETSDRNHPEHRAIAQVDAWHRGSEPEPPAKVQVVAERARARRFVPVDDLEEPDDLDLEELLSVARQRQWLRAKLANGLLDERERQIMAQRLCGVSLRRIGQNHNVSRERIRQIETEVLLKLQQAAVREGLTV